MVQTSEDGKSKKDIEAGLLEHEHRTFRVVLNFLKTRKLPREDSRRRACRRALLWRIFSPGTALASGVGIASLFTVYFAYQANLLLREQNVLAEASRRSALVYELSGLMDRIGDFLESDKYKTQLENYENNKNKYSRQFSPKLPKHLEGRITSLSRAFRPYRYYDDSGKMISRPLSPERGQLFVFLNGAGINFDYPFGGSVNFRYSDLRGITIEDSLLYHVTLDGSNLRDSELSHVKFVECSMRQADLRNTKFSHCELAGNLSLDGSDIRGSDLTTSDVRLSSFVENGKPIVKWDSSTRFPKEIEEELTRLGLTITTEQ